MDDASIEIVAYDNSWPSKFEIERSLLEVALAPWLVGGIEHMGGPRCGEPSCQANNRHDGASSLVAGVAPCNRSSSSFRLRLLPV